MDKKDVPSSAQDAFTDFIDEEGNIDTSRIPRRPTILDYPQISQFPSITEIQKSWIRFTESIRRKIIIDPEVRGKVAKFATAQVNEQLPLEFLKEVSTDEDISKILPYLEIPSVPDEFIVPDVSNAQNFDSPEKLALVYAKYRTNSTKETVVEELKRDIQRGAFLAGLTSSEKDLIITRYKFARDVKMLALMASMFDQKVDETNIVLSNGIKIGVNKDVASLHPELFDPSAWLKRQQIKDRVYLVTIGEKKFILKERKTSRHKDTNSGGHIETLTSEEEFKTAQLFNEQATLEDGGAVMKWEKPICYVEFPDGFQFTVFEAEEDLIDGNYVTHRYASEMARYPERYKEEYDRIKQKALEHLNDPEVVQIPDYHQRTGLLLRLFGEKKLEPLSFQEFCALKALFLRETTYRMQEEAMDTLGYGINDCAGYMFQIVPGKDHKLVRVGFDFEHYYKKPPPQFSRQDGKPLIMHTPTLGDLPYTNPKIAMAAYIAMSEEEGLIRQNN